MTTPTLTRGTSIPPTPPARDGDVTLRTLEPGDSAAVLAVFAGMGPRSRELRFLGPKPRLTDLDLQALTAVDQHDHVAILAYTAHDDRPIGIARFIRDGSAPESAELAVEVADARQRDGVGTILVRALMRRALEVGVQRFTVLVSRDNLTVLRMLRRHPAGSSLTRIEGGTAEYVVPLKGEPPC